MVSCGSAKGIGVAQLFASRKELEQPAFVLPTGIAVQLVLAKALPSEHGSRPESYTRCRPA